MDDYKTKIIEAFEEHIIKDVDGFYYLSFSDLYGTLDAAALRILADYIDTLNEEWEQIIRDIELSE